MLFLWVVLVSSVLLFLFRGAEGGFSTVVFATLVFAIPFSAVATLIEKWILEAKFKKSGSSDLSDGRLSNFAKFVSGIFFLLIAVSFISPLFILFGLYYVSEKVIKFSSNKNLITSVPWYICGALYSILFYFAFPLLLNAVLYVPFQMPDQPFIWDLQDLFGVFVLDNYISFFVPVIFYEWYRVRKGPGVVSKLSILWFILVPTVARLLFYVFNLSANPQYLSWIIWELGFLILLGILIPSVWIFWRERTGFTIFSRKTI